MRSTKAFLGRESITETNEKESEPTVFRLADGKAGVYRTTFFLISAQRYKLETSYVFALNNCDSSTRGIFFRAFMKFLLQNRGH